MQVWTLLAMCSLLPPAQEVDTPKPTTGALHGRVTWEGERPEPVPDLAMKDAELEGCCEDPAKMDRKAATLLIGKAGGVANVVLTLTARGYERALPEEPIHFDQKGCRFVPHVAIVPLGAALKFTNSDGTNHNIHTYSRKNQPENKNVAKAGELLYKPEHVETIEVKCDIHPWMKGHVFVTDDTHYALTEPDGSFQLGDIPPGEYTLSWWHEEVGKGKTAKVTIEAGKVASLTHGIGLEKKAKPRGRSRPRGTASFEPEPEPEEEPEEVAEEPAPPAKKTAPQAPAPVELPERGDGTPSTISGRIVWKGDRPEPRADLAMQDAELEGCCEDPADLDRRDATLLIDEDGGVANVVVTLTAKGYERALPEEPIHFDQKGCRFVPHVAIVPLGAELVFTNSDGTNHNIHTYSRKNQPENKNVAKAGELLYRPEHVETIEVRCDIHPWMKGHVFVTDDTHYALSKPDGSFELQDVPEGEYTLSWWHEELGKGKVEQVKVLGGEVTKLTHGVSAERKSTGGGRRRPRRP